jgi:hypothetical protein
MCKRHCTIDFNFICFTDDIKDINPEITIHRLPPLPLHSWWLKMYIFNKDAGLTGDILFLDLDIVIFNNIDKLWQFKPANFLLIRDFTRHVNPGWDRFNSSVFRFNAEKNQWIWDKFFTDHNNIMKKMHGDQDYLFSILKGYALYWPDEWIQSYKWEMREKNEIQLIDGKRNFTTVRNPKILPDGCIAVFHGEPKPLDSRDPWVIRHWQ